MAISTAHATIASTADHKSAIARFAASVSAYFERRARVNETVRELSEMTDRELADIGIARSDIYRIAREAQ